MLLQLELQHAYSSHLVCPVPEGQSERVRKPSVREQLLASVHKGIRAAAIDSFNEEVQGGSDQALDLVIGMLQDQEFQVRMSAIRVISALLTTRDATAEADRNAQLKTEGKMDHEYVQFPVSRCSASV